MNVRKLSDLPATLPIFPLGGALLFPRAQMPLNIFEPRYLNMVDDAMRAERLIGMVQPRPLSGSADKPAVQPVGCVGKITSFAETEDGRYLITLNGLIRFRITRELELRQPYRQVEADFSAFAADLIAPSGGNQIDRPRLLKALKRYAEGHGFQIDWTAVDSAEPEPLVNAIATLCPFDPLEKQGLLEAPGLDSRCATLITLLELNAASGDRREGRLQ
jgi:uncharacterized protein